MKRTALLGLMLLANVGFALSAFPDGKFEGQGKWKSDNGQSGEYTETFVLQNNAFQTNYKFLTAGAATEESLKGKIEFDANDFFKITLEGVKELATGYCGSTWCHYELKDASGGTLEESLAFVGDDLYKLGSKSEAGVKVFWEEKLSKVQ